MRDGDVIRVVNRRTGATVGESVVAAVSFRARLVGLLGRSGLDPGEGLWLAPCRSIHTFFMRFTIDVVFLDAGGRVTRCFPALRPWRTARGGRGARGVLELRAGTIAASDIRTGDPLDFFPAAQRACRSNTTARSSS